MKATVQSTGILGRMVLIIIGGDPFDVYVDHRQLSVLTEHGEERITSMATKTDINPKELRRMAKSLGIQGYQEMGRAELAAAVAEAEGADQDTGERKARKAKSTTAPAKSTKRTRSADADEEAPAKRTSKKAAPAKAAAKKATAKATPEGPNPFRPNTNLWHITEALMKGGKRSTLVTRLLPKLEYNPRTKDEATFDAELETDRRLKVVGYLLKNRFGFEYEHRGRGKDAYIKATPPAA